MHGWALFVVPLLAQAAVVDTARVVVACAGDDVEATGRLQRQLETTLATGDVSVVGAEELVDLWGLGQAVDPGAILDAGRETLREASAAYYEDSLAEASQKLREVERLYETGAVPAEAYRELLLWKLTVSLARGDDAAAEIAARQVIMSAGAQWRLDEENFRPSVVAFVERVREQASAWPRLRVVGLPATASVRVDSVPVSRTFLVPPGPHALVADAPGYRTLTTTVELTQTRALDLGMSLDLPAEQLRQLREVSSRGNTLREMSDAFVFASVGDHVMEIVVAGASRVRSRRFPLEDTALALQWVAQAVRRTVVPGASNGREIRVEVGTHGEEWRHSVSGSNATGYRLYFVGWGPVLDVDVAVRHLRVRTTLAYTTFSLGVPLVQDPRYTVVHRLEGGRAALGRVSAMYDPQICMRCAWSVALGAELVGETQTIPDITDPLYGGPAGLGGLQQRVDLGPVVRGTYDARILVAALTARVGVPLSVREDPLVTSFDLVPRASWGLEARISTAPWNPRFRLHASYFVRGRSVVGTDIALTATDPFFSEPVATDLRHGARVQVSWSL